ncbi:GNAT family N-acetyltransferase [Adhaeribacter pallidiroseus]|uniref:Gentamicin 3-N-acetyltransferase n=1 Tax=Adhaeribacter pallidiroseus TaxID=2072847 RepID=A0A369QHV1_9BACT|nr:GNAT family N-acetyltransferase [Adhaeribacter pallidiroseus]RDC64002.1 Gentamicin 3-N-acetyltransferase [Adhaeribacter pallidiroseus]
MYDIAVKPAFQRKGIGRQLLDTLLHYSQQNGFINVFVPANEEDTHALDFYHATGGNPEKVVYFTYVTNKNF